VVVRQRGSLTFELILYVAIAVAVVGSIYAVYSYIDHHWETTAGIERGAKDKQAEWDAANAKQRKAEADKSAKAATGLEKGNADAKVVYRTITQRVDRYIDRAIYRAECFDDDGLSDANSALLGKITTGSKPDGTLPKPDASSGRFRGIGIEKAN
jgi:hypothetical protein